MELCLALFTLAVIAGNQGFLAIGDWLKSYGEELKELFEVKRIPSYSTIRRALLGLDYEDYSARLAKFFEIKPLAAETLALDGKALRGSYLLSEENPYCEPHKAITLVTAYLVERGLILKPEEVENKSNEITAVPKLIETLAVEGVVFAFDAINTQKTIETIIESGNHYLAAVKGNQPKLYQAVREKFIEHDSFNNICKGHGRIEKRQISTAYFNFKLPGWLSVKTVIRVDSERQLKYKTEFSTRYYISDLTESAFEFYQRIRGYWGVENKVP